MSRLRFLAAIAVLAALSAVLVACGGGGSDKSGESPQTVLDEATLQGIESANVELDASLGAPGAEGGRVDLILSGPFQGEGEGELPQLAMNAKASGHYNGKKIDFDGGLTLLPNTAFVQYEGVQYEVDPTTYSFIEQTLKQQQRENGAEPGAAGVAGCQEEFGQLKVADFLEEGKNEGSAEVGGTKTTEISGELNAPSAIESLLEVVESPACRNQLSAAGPLPSTEEIESAKGEVERSVKSAHVDVYVGEDNIVRRIAGRVAVEPKNGGSGPKSAALEFDLRLTEVNEEQKISAPENAKPLSRLFIKLNINPIELLGLLQGEEGGQSLGELFEGLGEGAGQ
jgi:hypothetical protein